MFFSLSEEEKNMVNNLFCIADPARSAQTLVLECGKV
jgi:hypothetical protein